MSSKQNNSNSKKTACIQSDFLDILDKKAPDPIPSSPKYTFPAPASVPKRQPLSKKQVMGFRQDYDEAMITLYVISSLCKTEEDTPPRVEEERQKAQKVKERYERYNPKAKQNITQYGRDVVDAYMSPDHSFLHGLRCRAENAKHSEALWHSYIYAQDTVDRIIAYIKDEQFYRNC